MTFEMPPLPALPVLSRLLAAIFGGYLLASSAIVASAMLAPDHRASAVMASSLLSYAIYTAAVIWTFAARTTRAAWLGLLAPAALLLMLAGLAWAARGLA
ncbi:hypothetical protein [Cupriavidus agavae]|uniref:DUF3649 domain-containing protein n=1 Tax=Cupriavidus agavae TaxID=1001822 RepID=A0A4Q7RZN9_9BURK|nr:hypothetical protein [Cupriavidus agavae]RZT39344.1 hypothetical protein EV147_2539 [Cupriavidus agavae]